MKYRVRFLEDFYTLIHETVIYCPKNRDIRELVKDYKLEHLANEDTIAGAEWSVIEE